MNQMSEPTPIKRLNSSDADFASALAALTRYEPSVDRGVVTTVTNILADVKARGDAAVLEYTRQFDRIDIPDAQTLRIGVDELKNAFDHLDPEAKQALGSAADRVRRFHERQLEQTWTYTEADGTRLGQRINPVDRAGLYVPGGKAAYPSSVLMNALPAAVAGVRSLAMVVPTPDGVRNQMVLAAAHVAGVTEVLTIGGAQAVGALAFGTESIDPVDKITGPGNAYVAEAKRQVFGTVGIDMIAGPSEILVLCDGSVNPDWVAMDLFSQAEHDEMAQAILLCPDADFIDQVQASIDRLLMQMPRADVIRQSLADRGALIQVSSMAQACEVTNQIAPEHLELMATDPQPLIEQIRHAGAIFIGPYSSEALGDYCAGPNHVLPTMRTARFSSPLGVYDFQKRSSLIEVSAEGAQTLGPIAGVLADAEGLAAHAASARLRLATGETAQATSTPESAAAAVVRRVVSPVVRHMSAYPVAEGKGFLKLDAMENPYELSDELRQVFGARLAALPINRYPVPSYTPLKTAIRDAFEIPSTHPVVVGNGSDELISMLALLVRGCGPILAPAPSFVMYEIGARLTGSRFVGVALDEQFQLRLPAMLEAIEQHRPALVYLAYPNNPTGAPFDRAAVQAIIETAPGLVVIDEAYQPFAGTTWMHHLPAYPNLVVMRTVSKIGLAGIRIGYLSAAPEITAELEKVRPPYNISVLDEAAALFALEHKKVLDEQAALLVKARSSMQQALNELAGVTAYESATNFVLARLPDGDAMHQALFERQIMVRNVGKMHPLLNNCLRLTVSTPAENDQLLAAMKSILTS